MSDIFRVCIMGRYYDIPTSEISIATLESLKSLVDETNNIHPRDLLRTFLEYSEINNLLKNEIIKANQKIQNAQNVESQNPLQAADLLQETINAKSPSQEGATSVQSDNLNQVKSN
ncbi:MAG: hypothetical protein K2N75_08085 [Helicobacter sp.]|uniref:hypothetical protein n=1 Tax=Helicobacter sp. TaxID=218 RepID=UPI0023D2372C|nr:hypothetical protein [Helicobacter sp.]MDE7175980.1 hypothetical protein [Helicobacter sp.]